jgi:phage FluMu gp28-like protein
MEFINDSIIEFKSADNPDNLRGEGLRRVVIDEAARVKKEVFEEVVRPAISDTAGRVLFISTPKGKNWFYDMWTKGQDPLIREQYQSWKFPTADNPKVPEGDINEAKESLPQDVFNQEYLAEFLEDAAGVFRNVRRCAIGKPQEPVKGRKYYAGIDLARVTDFTVLIIFDEYGNQVYMDRFNILDWQIQRRRLVDALQKYNNALALIDATAMGGDIFLEDMRRDYRWTEGYKFTNESKKQIIELLMISFEKERIKIFADPVLTNELGIFEYKVNPSGTISYNAPDGYHDDAVIALALANWKLYHGPRFIFSLSENDIY